MCIRDSPHSRHSRLLWYSTVLLTTVPLRCSSPVFLYIQNGLLSKEDQKLPQMCIRDSRRILCPYWQELIQEGIQDGSVQTEYPKEMAELLVLLDLWMIPSLFPADAKEQSRKYRFISEMLKKIGLELYDEEIEEMISKLPYYDQES